MQLEITDCSLAEILNHIESLMAPFAAEKGLRFELTEQTILPPMIRTDTVRLRQCLTNLINNAIKFTDSGHVLVRASLIQTDDKPFVRFEVEDTGPGIPAEVQEKIFEAFEQADGSTTRKYGGTGLGLTITRHLTELLGGKLSLISESGKGTIFTIEIPANIDIHNQAVQNRRNFPIPQKRCKVLSERFEGHILVAEDVRTNQVLIRILLEQLGLKTTVVDNGQSAIEQALMHTFDLIIMDMQMPTLNGFDATRQLRKRGIKIPVIALTAGAIKGDQQKCLAAGCDEYLAKPIDRKQLVAILAQYLPAAKPANQIS
jgi:CheY-like chemotaxis protein/two-component sensor histidine kinase